MSGTVPKDYVQHLPAEVPARTDAQNKMHDAMLELYRNRSFQDISVKELTETAHVARTTFYYYYQNLSELLEEVEDDLLVTIMARRARFFDLPITSAEDCSFLVDYLPEVFPNLEAYHIFMIEHINGRFLQKWRSVINDSMEKRLRRIGRIPEQEAFQIDVAQNLIFNLVMFYLEHPTEEGISYLKEYVYFNVKYLGLES